MAPGPLESRDVPGVLDQPVTRWQGETTDQRELRLAWERLPALCHHAETSHPVGMLAPAGERPPSVDPPAVSGRLGRTCRLRRPGKDHVGAVPVDLIVRLA